MRMPWIMVLLCVVVSSVFFTSACGSTGGGGETAIAGLVTKVDTSAKTFSVNSGGKDYDFKMTATSKGDIAEIKEHMDLKKSIDVKYKGSSSPYEVVDAD